MNPLLKSFALAAALLLAVPAARAQDMDAMPAIQNAYMSSHIANLSMNSLLENDRRAGIDPNTGRKRGVAARPAPGSAPAAPAKTVSFAYQPTAALKTATVQGYVERLKAKNPAASQVVAQQLGPGKNDYGQIYHGIVQGTGLRDNDAADALAAYTVLGWMIVNDVRDDKSLPAGAAPGLRAQLLPKMAQNAQLTAAGVPAKLGEEMKLLCVITQAGWQSAIKEGKLPAYRQGVAALFKNQYGTDLNAP